MWHTDYGDRTLEGVEARLFAEALWDFVQELEVYEDEYEELLKKAGFFIQETQLSILDELNRRK